MKYKFLLVMMAMVIIFSCKSERRINNIETVEIEKETRKNKFELLLEAVLNEEQLKESVSLVRDKTDLKLFIIKNDSIGITSDLNLEMDGNEIEFIDYENVKRDSLKNVIYFESFEVIGDTARVKYFHIIRGLGGMASFIYVNNGWQKNFSEYWYD